MARACVLSVRLHEGTGLAVGPQIVLRHVRSTFSRSPARLGQAAAGFAGLSAVRGAVGVPVVSGVVARFPWHMMWKILATGGAAGSGTRALHTPGGSGVCRDGRRGGGTSGECLCALALQHGNRSGTNVLSGETGNPVRSGRVLSQERLYHSTAGKQPNCLFTWLF